MDAETFAEWLRRQGHRVVHTASCYWYDAGPQVYQAFPYHWIIDPVEDELIDSLPGGQWDCFEVFNRIGNTVWADKLSRNLR